MKPVSIMLIAGDTSGDVLAAELVGALRKQILAANETSDGAQPLRTELAPVFFGAGGPRMKAAGVELAFDMTQHSVIGHADAVRNIFTFARRLRDLRRIAIERQPDVIIGVDFGGFNLRLGGAIKKYTRKHSGAFRNWQPKLVQFVSPQVWASRPGRAYQLAANYDLLLSLFPFEKEWYARRVPGLRVEFVGHPMMAKRPKSKVKSQKSGDAPTVLLLPGSRTDEMRRHLPVIYETAEALKKQFPNLRALMVVPNEKLKEMADTFCQSGIGYGAGAVEIETRIGGLPDALELADLAITKSGTITMECAAAGVPAVVFYKTSWPTYLILRPIVTIRYIAMPNVMADEEIYPEFIQHTATAENISRAALELLRNENLRQTVKDKLAKVTGTLGGAGATDRAAEAIVSLLK